MNSSKNGEGDRERCIVADGCSETKLLVKQEKANAHQARRCSCRQAKYAKVIQ